MSKVSFYRHWLPIIIVSFIIISCRHEPNYKIGVSQCSDDDWRQMMNEEIEREIMFYPEASVEIRSASDNSARQIEDIRYFIDNDFDMIIAAPNEADALTPIIKEAYDKGIPVVVFDRSIHGESFTAFQGADNAAIGCEAAKYAHNLMPSGATVLELRGLQGSTPADERERGFHETADSLGNRLNIVASVSADWKFEEARIAADSLLAVYPDVDIIYAHNDRMALGAAEAAAAHGLHPHIIGIDAAPAIGMQAVADGQIDATFIYPTHGGDLVKTAMAILKGEPYERITLIPATPAVDREKAELLLLQARQLAAETTRMKALKGEVDSYWAQHNSQTSLLIAIIAILVLVCIVLFLVLRTFWQHRRHKDELLEKNRQLEEATQSKLMFFTNVSHDLRTPLTLIAEPVEQVAAAPNLDRRQKALMHIADKNVKILRRLINQILDFRKYENGKLDLNLEEVSVASLIAEWSEAFNALAAKKHIRFETVVNLPEGFTVAIDVDKIERVVFNLLSNAFKYTPVKGSIDFVASLEGEYLKLRVSDTGRGISSENLKNIFSRFYQVDKVRPEGSGIGLSLAKAFVEVHGGTITAESEEEKGTQFTVLLPVRHVDNKASEATLGISRESAKAVAQLLADDHDDPLPVVIDEDSDKPRILIIDDNEDVRAMVKELLADSFSVIGAGSGKQGVRRATRYVPDLIICDVMMPGIDGMETCRILKNEISTSHIPVLMLTACSLDEQRAKGYESGADGYMSKPFNGEVLRARIDSLIANRRKIKEVLGSDIQLKKGKDSDRESAPRDVEKEFYARLISLINKEMGNVELSVDSIAEKMGMGRSQFYRKIKALTNLSPVELLRDMRLKHARDLLLTTDKTISEIAYEVGFATPAYFTKCYRETYRETPSDTRTSLS